MKTRFVFNANQFTGVSETKSRVTLPPGGGVVQGRQSICKLHPRARASCIVYYLEWKPKYNYHSYAK